MVGKASGSNDQRLWAVQLANHGLGAGTGAQITGVAVTQSAGTACSPAASVLSSFPLLVGDVLPSASGTAQATFNFNGCPATARFTVVVNFSANGGTYAGSTVLNNQTR